MRIETRTLGFVRALAGGETAMRAGARYVLKDGRALTAGVVRDLIARGAIAGDGTACNGNGVTAGWIRRARLDGAELGVQHRHEVVLPDGRRIDLSESPLGRLAVGEAAFLAPHQVLAGERLRRLVERAQLQPQLTVRYSSASSRGSGNQAADLSDMAMDARRQLDRLYAQMPRDCIGVAVDVCGFLTGLEDIERRYDLPRRTGKLVLRIALEQIALLWGLAPIARGPEHLTARGWMDDGARPSHFG